MYLLALTASNESCHLVEDGIEPLEAWNSPMNLASVQFMPRAPGDDTERKPAFFHPCGTFKWSLERVLQVWNRQNDVWAYAKSTSWSRSSLMYEVLHLSGRLFASPTWQDSVDPERLFWTGMEDVACWSRAEGSAGSCSWVRERMSRSLGADAARLGGIHACPLD